MCGKGDQDPQGGKGGSRREQRQSREMEGEKWNEKRRSH